MVKNTPSAWGPPANLLHWLSALLIIFLIVYGWWMTHEVERSGRFAAYQFHSLIGYYAFVVVALRLGWRAFNPTPALPTDSLAWERAAAHASHALLYVLTVALSLTGWLMAGLGRRTIEAKIFGLPVPLLSRTPDRALHDLLEDAHRVMAYVLLALIVIHVVAALRHHIVKKNDVLRRMWFAN
jgi:cytochrome b561